MEKICTEQADSRAALHLTSRSGHLPIWGRDAPGQGCNGTAAQPSGSALGQGESMSCGACVLCGTPTFMMKGTRGIGPAGVGVSYSSIPK